jgi:hypothetical protein
MSVISFTPTSTAPTVKAGDVIECAYCGSVLNVRLGGGVYKLECWGAQGGSYSTDYSGGLGGYSSGILFIPDPTETYVYVGG